MRRAAASAVVLAVALMAQLTVVNRLTLPGAGAPDLVLLTVVAFGLCSRPVTASVTGFCAGLCLDIAPPGSYLIGEYALVFCLVGYLCGRLRGLLNQSAMLTIAGAMAAAAAGEALVALLGLAVSDPQVSWAAVQKVLPSSIVYDVVVTPFLLYLVMRAVRLADGLGREGAAGAQQADGSSLLGRAGGTLSGAGLPGATVLGGAGLLGGAGWLAGPVGSRGGGGPRPARGRGKVHTPSTPRLREAAARSGDGWVGGGPRPRLSASAGLRPARPPIAGRPGRPPRLRPGAGTPGSAHSRPPRALPRSPANLRIGSGRRRDGSLGRALGSGAAGTGAPGGSALRGRPGSGPPGSAFRGRRPSAARPGAARPASAGRAGSHGAPRFRPDTRLPGGSSNEATLRSAALHRSLPGRRVNLRLAAGRRHDGIVGGSALRRGALAGRGLGTRPVSLRLGSGRRGDGALGALGALSARPPWARTRRAAPRFRSGPAVGGYSLPGKRARLRAGKRARFGSGRSSFLATWTGGRLGGRSTVWRIGSKRTGGFR